MPGQRIKNHRSQPPAIPTGMIEVDVSGYQECLRKDRLQMLSSEMNLSASLPHQIQGKHIGSAMEIEPLLLDLAPNKSTSLGKTYQKLGETPFLFEPKDQSASAAVSNKMLRNIQRLAGSNLPDLVDIFETVVQPSLPVVAADAIQQSKTGGIRTWNPVLLGAIAALSQLWSLDDEKKQSLSSATAAELEELAFNLYSQSLSEPSISTIQAGLLLIQLPDIDTKRVNMELVDAAFGLGLHLDCSAWTVPASEKRLRKRLAWAVYMQDKWCSLIHGRPSAISSNNWIVQSLGLDDFDPSDNASTNLGRDIFLQMTSLTEILSLILDTFYTSRALDEIHSAGTGGTRMILERAKPAQIQLKKWYSTLPAHLKLEANMDNGMSSIGHLHLAYFCAEITLHRTIIRSLAHGSTSNISAAEARLADICRAAAKTRLISVMEFVNRLRPAQWQAFWYFPSRSALALVGSFGALLRATAPGHEEAAFYAARLQEYRWTLSASAHHAPFVHQALASLDDAETLLLNLPEKPSATELAEARESAKSSGMRNGNEDRDGGNVDDDNMDDDDDDDDDDDAMNTPRHAHGRGQESDEEDDDDDDGDMDVDIDEGTASVTSEKSSHAQSTSTGTRSGTGTRERAR